ncbi:hypothetical protein [Flavobacterium sp. GCM10027622]|uniref:hypothetical protein n=1 Tax=unclassified Flavobacterium TaxID=196869 RepID=UPI0036D3DB82
MKRKVLFLYVFISLSHFGCKTNTYPISEKTKLKNSNPIVNIQTGYEIREMYSNSIKYQYELNRKSDTVSLRTYDKKFTTKEGYRVGTKWKDVAKKLTDSVYKLSGFGYYIELESGYNLLFCVGTTCTDNFPNENTEVVCIEKRIQVEMKTKSLLFKK